MIRLFLLLSLLWACDGDEQRPTDRSAAAAVPEAEPTVDESEAAEAVDEAEPAEEPGAFYVAERPAPFFLVDDCDGAVGATMAAALRECRRLAADGRPHLRRMCDCRPPMVLEVTPSAPIAFYRGCCWAPGDTPAEAHAECERRVAEGWCEPPHPRRVDVVTGPYDRPGTGGLYEDAGVHRYLARWPGGEHFDWVDESGEPPCFAAGTAVATPHGPVPIERVVEGDRVLTVHDGREVAVPVLRVKAREVRHVLALSLGGSTLRVTPEHPLRAGDRWVRAQELRVGDRLRTRDGDARVDAIDFEEGGQMVHALRVGAPHTYFAGGVLAHNY